MVTLMKRVLVTGATGFVGGHLCEMLIQHGYRVRAALRSDGALANPSIEKTIVGEIGSKTQWEQALDGVDSVVHCAAVAHIMSAHVELQGRYTECNELGTKNLADACVRARVSRFVYISTIKVNGEMTGDGPFTNTDRVNPVDPYALSKWRAELHLAKVSADSSLEISIVRPPLIYGPKVRANFLRLLRWVDAGVPLPFGRVENLRSLVSVWNLCDLIERLLRGPVDGHRVFMVSDGYDLSSKELIRRIGQAMNRPVRLIPVPLIMLRAMGALSGRSAEIERLCGSLRVDISATCDHLSWKPYLSVDESLVRTVQWYRSR